MNYFSYVIEHDYGLAPNPFGGYCTLAVCKPDIRRNENLQIGDWIIGTGGKKLRRQKHLIFAMKLEEKITFQEYWNDPRFQYKKPLINGSLVQMYGDNFYTKDNQDEWKQINSAHSGKYKKKHIKRDTKSENVLISKNFYYLGDKSKKIPKEFEEVCNTGRNMKYKELNNIGVGFIKWVESEFSKGITGDPINWVEHNQLKLFMSWITRKLNP